MIETKAKVFRFDDIDPRSSGEKVDVFPLVTAELSESFGMNFSVFRDCDIDWKINYDEALHCLEGQIDIIIDGKSHLLGPHDSIWLPAGTSLTYRAAAATVLAIFSPVEPDAT